VLISATYWNMSDDALLINIIILTTHYAHCKQDLEYMLQPPEMDAGKG